MRKELVLCFLLLFLLLLSPMVFSQEVQPLELQLNQVSFQPGDTVEANAVVRNPFPEPAVLELQAYMGHYSQPFPSQVFHRKYYLQGEEEKEVNVFWLKVDDELPEGKCFFRGALLANGQEMYSEKKNFSLPPVKGKVSLEVSTCRDVSCIEESSVFVKGEKMNLVVKTVPGNPLLNLVVLTPYGQESFDEKITNFQPQEEGSYQIIATASSPGLSSGVAKTGFAVVGSEVDIPTQPIGHICNVDGVCDTEVGENYGNCGDCPSGGADDYCDGVKDGKCDPDCEEEDDPDCAPPSPVDTGLERLFFLIFLVVFGGGGALALIVLFLKKVID